MKAENYEIAAARVRVLIAKIERSEIDDWIKELAAQPFGPASNPPPEGLREWLSRRS